jgi:hypothetical protein
VTDDAVYLGINQLLGNDRTLFRVGLIILRHQFEFNLGATDFQTLGVQFFDRQHGAVFVILTQVSLRAGHRRHMAEFDDHFRLGCRRGGRRRGGYRWRRIFLAAG